MAVTRITERPGGTRSVPVLTDPDVSHYPEFATFLSDTFELTDKPLEGRRDCSMWTAGSTS